MEREYFVVFNSDYDEKEFEEKVDVYNLQYYYSPQTYYQPQEEELTYNIWLDKDFDKAYRIIGVDFDEEGEGKKMEIFRPDNETAETVELGKGDWWNYVEDAGYRFFDRTILNDGFKTREDAAHAVQAWIEEVADEKAWDYWENRE